LNPFAVLYWEWVLDIDIDIDIGVTRITSFLPASLALLPRREQLLGQRSRVARVERVLRVVGQADLHRHRGRRHDLQARLSR
jgi:hypothetical protein